MASGPPFWAPCKKWQHLRVNPLSAVSIEMAILNTSDPPVPPEKLPRWPIFLDCCNRRLTGLVDEDDESD